jgi:hypothetical protein
MGILELQSLGELGSRAMPALNIEAGYCLPEINAAPVVGVSVAPSGTAMGWKTNQPSSCIAPKRLTNSRVGRGATETPTTGAACGCAKAIPNMTKISL